MDLDALIVLPYCPGFSAYNMIEHAWAPLSNMLTSVILPDMLPYEENAPCKQKLQAAEKKKQKCLMVL